MNNPAVAWSMRRLTVGEDLNGELGALPEPFRSMAAHLARVSVDPGLKGGKRREALATARAPLWEAMLAAFADREGLIKAMDTADPEGPAPEAEPGPSFATVADVRRVQGETRWVWDGWIPTGRVFGLAGFEGTGKTRTAMDLHRRVWHRLTWPDNQAPTLAPGRPAVWLCSDGHHDELAELLPAFGLPDESVVFPSPPDEPYGGTDIDAPELIGPGGLLEEVIAAVNPWCVFIDTLTSATSLDLCDQRVMKGLKTPLVRLAQTFGVNVCLMLHLSREGQALGRRVKGITRTLMHLECPDPEGHPERLRYWVEKSYAKKPPQLGATLGGEGNAYDFDPPRKPEPEARRPGPPPAKLEACKRWLGDRLTPNPDRVSVIRKDAAAAKVIPSEGSADTLYRAKDALKVEEYELDGRKWWKMPAEPAGPKGLGPTPGAGADAPY